MTASELAPALRETLDAVLDELIPPSRDGRMPGAGQAGTGAAVAAVLAEHPIYLPMIEQGLSALDERARELGADRFGALPSDLRVRALEASAETHPGLIPSLVFHTYSAYYRVPEVVAQLDIESRPPHPLGYEMEPNDLSLVEVVKARPKLYRD